MRKLNNIALVMSLFLVVSGAQAQSIKQTFDFKFEGFVLSGMLNQPQEQQPKGIVLIVHGSGRTNAVAQDWYSGIRESVVKAGYTTYIWDKMGCGSSGGTFNYNQPVHNSALEVIAAINTLKELDVPGSENIGLLGFSRAGWINPIVINEYKNIDFWISVSGVDDKENWGYLLEQNLRISGMPQDSIDLIVGQWIEGTRIFHSGGSLEAYQEATKDLEKNAFRLRFVGETLGERDKDQLEEEYYHNQESFMQESLDEETGLQILVEDFDAILSKVSIPVLALFGERDMNVDWRKTKSLYVRTLGQNTELTIRSFPDCNHNMFQCKTGGFYEFEDNDLPYVRCDGFLDTIESWLKKR